MKKFFKRIHKWIAIPVGIVIFIICLTGVILSFQKEILQLLHPEWYTVEKIGEMAIPLTELIPMVNKQLDGNWVAGVTIAADAADTYSMSLKEGFRVTAFVDPYTGKVLGIYNYSESFFYKIFSLHRWLMDDTRTWGKMIVGVSTICFVIILITGILVWIPKTKKSLKSRLSVTTKYGWRRFWFDSHIVLGLYASLILLLCSLTGLMWSFDWYRTGVFSLFGVESKKEDVKDKKGDKKKREKGGRNEKSNKEEKPLETICWDDALAYLKQTEPAYQSITIQDGTATILPENASHNRANDQYKFDPKTGGITEKVLYKYTDESRRAMLWAYNLHVGAYGGIWTRILTCVACLIGASLPLTGYYMFYVKRKKKIKQ